MEIGRKGGLAAYHHDSAGTIAVQRMAAKFCVTTVCLCLQRLHSLPALRFHVIPGRANRREPGIHWAAGTAAGWIPDARLRRAPGMTVWKGYPR